MKFNKENFLKNLKELSDSKKFYFIALVVIILLITLALFIRENTNRPLNYIDPAGTELKGIDVSNHQGDIEWDKIDSEVVKYVYIKATEGTTYVDDYFKKNWNGASNSGFLKGAYHFYNVNNDGLKQAEHFIEVVPKESHVLPPVIDIETISDVESGKVILELKEYVEKIEAHYGVKPIFYANIDTYNLYIKDAFKDYLIWFPHYNTEAPAITDWTIWQYTDSGIVDGIDGPVDFNIFKGSGQDLIDLEVIY